MTFEGFDVERVESHAGFAQANWHGEGPHNYGPMIASGPNQERPTGTSPSTTT